jgi:1,4-dihydroxy-2-naphthoyl-CoA hydrolase
VNMAEMPTPEQVRNAMPFAALIGVELLEVSPELVSGRLQWSPERCTTAGLLHGGALMALADTCGGVCAFFNLPAGAIATATIESKTNFLRSVGEGAVTANSHPLHKGQRIIVLETEITRGDGALVAKVTQTQAFHYPESAQSRA